MSFDVYDCSLSLLRAVCPLLERLAGFDPSLTDQLRRASQSVVLNVSEGNRRNGRDRSNRFRIALGSAAEVSSCVDVAVALGYVAGGEYGVVAELADRVRAMTYRLANGRAKR